MLKIHNTGQEFEFMRYQLSINGELIPQNQVLVLEKRDFSPEFSPDFTANSDEIKERLLPLSLKEIFPLDESIGLDFSITDSFPQNSFDYSASTQVWRRDEASCACVIKIKPYITTWKKLWSIGQLLEGMGNLLSERGITHEHNLDNSVQFPQISIIFSELSADGTLESLIQRQVSVVIEIIERAEQSLKSQQSNDVLTMVFDFPDDVRVSCEQYLLYFAQFLKDLGVEASANLQHEAGQVLFSVTPHENQSETPAQREKILEKIRQALEIYLQFPSANLQNSIAMSGEIEVQRLMANIQHLNGQIMLAQAIIQSKDATIESKETTIAQLRNPGLFLPTLPVPEPSKEKDREQLLGGLVALKPYETRGADFNLPMIWRKLKTRFSEKDDV